MVHDDLAFAPQVVSTPFLWILFFLIKYATVKQKKSGMHGND